MKKTIVAPVGDYIDDIYVAIREFSTQKVILIAPKDKVGIADETKEKLEKFRIPTKIIEITGNIWEEMFKEVEDEKGSNLLDAFIAYNNSLLIRTGKDIDLLKGVYGEDIVA